MQLTACVDQGRATMRQCIPEITKLAKGEFSDTTDERLLITALANLVLGDILVNKVDIEEEEVTDDV